jgi:glycosyltransferase involved in cell wall biosynthesis
VVNIHPRLLFVVTEDWYFRLHWLPLAQAARESGYVVGVATRVNDHRTDIEACGCEVIPLQRMRRRSVNPLREVAAVVELLRLYRRWRPDIVHQVAMKPVLYGSLAALFARVRFTVNALPGLGFVYSSRSWLARALRPVVNAVLPLALSRRGAVAIVQNDDDALVLGGMGLRDRSVVRVIRGSGVDLERFRPRAGSETVPPIVMLASRMLWDKGVREFVEAAAALRASSIIARFVLVGGRDEENPTSVPEDVLAAWHRGGAVECWGQRSDMPEVFAQATIVCLPSYREGLPTALVEAAACGKPLVATDVPGCREVVQPGITGLLVRSHDAAALALALRTLLLDPELRSRMGRQAREVAATRFSFDTVKTATIGLYRDLVQSTAAARTD